MLKKTILLIAIAESLIFNLNHMLAAGTHNDELKLLNQKLSVANTDTSRVTAMLNISGYFMLPGFRKD